MKRRARFVWFIPFVLLIGSLLAINSAWGQDGTTSPDFALIQQLGRVRPQGIQYDPNFDQFVMVDVEGRLILVDGATFQTRYVLHEGEFYSIYTFSHDGRWLALGIDRRVELWDTQTGTLAAQVTPEEALGIQAPLLFSYDDNLLSINAVVPAPADLRRSENDTSNLPYLWDLPAARNEADTTLPQYFELYSFYDYRYGFILGPDRKVLTGLPQRLQVMDVANKNLPILAEISSSRAERDPISVWHSLRDDNTYVLNDSSFIQIDAQTGTPYTLPLGYDLTYRRLADLRANFLLSDQARIIGEPVSRETNSFLQLLFGANYRASWNYHPLTVMLIDVLNPITMGADQMGFLVYVYDEEADYGVLDYVRPADVMQMALHPDNTHLAVRRMSGAQAVEIYNLETGALERTLYPALPDPYSSQILAYNAAGDVLICDFQRFDAQTGAVRYEDLHYLPEIGSYAFSGNSREIVTITGNNWWVWDIETGQVIRRETLNLRGDVLAVEPDTHRYLTNINTEDGPILEIANVGTEDRRSVLITAPPGRLIFNILPSPDWENYLVIYGAYEYSQHYPGYEIALYNMDAGEQWFIAGDDLPPESRDYGWLDNDTVYISAAAESTQPDRIYGIDYHVSGLPQCLVDAFPDDWPRWLDLWEQLNAYLPSDELGRLAQRLCAAEPTTIATVEAVFFPSPTPTRPPITATPPFVAGVPACLTARFPDEALDYAAAWREMIAGLTPEQIADMENLICQGLQEASPLTSNDPGAIIGGGASIMTINIHSAARSVGRYMPSGSPALSRSMDMVLREFNRAVRPYYTPYDVQLSPDGTLLAMRDGSGFIDIYRLITPYESIAATITATYAPPADAPKIISVRPTATQAFDYAGEPRPTLTPTVTPTSPARPTTDYFPQDGAIEEICPSDPIYSISEPPPDYAATGTLLISHYDSPLTWRLDVATGEMRPDETIPTCESCEYSFDKNWIIWGKDGNQIVSRPDGSDARVLFYADSYPIDYTGLYWLEPATLEYGYSEYRLDLSPNPVPLHAYIDPASGEISEPFFPLDPIRVNQLYTEIIAMQPGDGSLALVRTIFKGASSMGYKYYIYDLDTGTAEYFARLVDQPTNDLVDVQWNPLGKALYYRYAGADDWYVFDVATRQHEKLGTLPGGTWSREGRYRVEWFTLPPDELQARIDAGQPVPHISVWDSDTGLTLRYCIPETEKVALWTDTPGWIWSPDSRYIVFQTPLDRDWGLEVTRPHTLVLDLQSGRLTELTFDASSIRVWMGGDDATP